MAHGRIALSLVATMLVGGALSAQAPVRDAQALAAKDRVMSLRNSLGLDRNHDFSVRSYHADHLGQAHTRLQQTYQGVKVWGGEIITHSDRNGRQMPDTNATVRGLNLSVEPSLDAKEVLGLVHADLNPMGPYAYEPTAELVIFRVQGRFPTLAYHVSAKLHNGTPETKHMEYFVDAHSGAILEKYDVLHTAAATGTGNSQYNGTVTLNTNTTTSGYELRDTTRGGGNYVSNMNGGTSSATIYTDADNTWGDGANYSGSGSTSANGQTAAVDAAYGVQLTWDMFKNFFGRNGIDGAGRQTYSRVHYSKSYVNAFWDDSCFCMTYGDGDTSQGFTVLTSLDVAAHELSHGVCASEANLNYSGESGGLNEANSDIFAALAELYSRNGFVMPTTAANTDNAWKIGEQLSSTPLRYMTKPSKDGASKDAWSSTLGSLDVHYSSGPMNRCFFFMSQGSSTSSTSDYYSSYVPGGFAGIGPDKAGKIWYRALSTYLTASSNYAAARTACLNAATDLYGSGSAEYNAVAYAFAAINVGSAPTPAGVSIAISPATATVNQGATYQFTASVTGSTNTSVTWKVTESAGGTVSSTGLYTAPATAGTYHVVVTSAADTSKTATATITVPGTPDPGTGTEKILNGGFESGATSWSGTTGAIGAWTGQTAYEGTKCAWLGGNGKTTTETLYQTVSIPSTATSAVLSFYLHIDTAETTTSTQYDKMVVSLQNSAGTTLKSLATYSNLNKTTGYTQKSFDVSAYKGQTIRVYFKATEDSSLQTSFVVDKVSLVVK